MPAAYILPSTCTHIMDDVFNQPLMLQRKDSYLCLCRGCLWQVRQVGKEFYNTEIKCEELQMEETHGTTYCQIRLIFDNSASCTKTEPQQLKLGKELNMPITSIDFFALFPFHMVLNS